MVSAGLDCIPLEPIDQHLHCLPSNPSSPQTGRARCHDVGTSDQRHPCGYPWKVRKRRRPSQSTRYANRAGPGPTGCPTPVRPASMSSTERSRSAIVSRRRDPYLKRLLPPSAALGLQRQWERVWHRNGKDRSRTCWYQSKQSHWTRNWKFKENVLHEDKTDKTYKRK